jgi:sugar phosphate isomerase/epimerase
LHLIGGIDARRDPPNAAEAEDYYRRALELAEELGMRPLAAHCHLGLGRLSKPSGEPGKSGTHIETATAMYRDMNMKLWLDRT